MRGKKFEGALEVEADRRALVLAALARLENYSLKWATTGFFSLFSLLFTGLVTLVLTVVPPPVILAIFAVGWPCFEFLKKPDSTDL